MALRLSPGDIVETIFIRPANSIGEKRFEHLINFSVDHHGRIRLSGGIVGTHDPDNMNFVPPARFSINASPWNAHDTYVEIELPNPANEPEKYRKIRAAFIEEMNKRLHEKLVKKAA